MRRLLLILAMLLFVSATSEAKSHLDFTVPDSAALLLFDTGGSGSGIYLNTGNSLYFVTAKHVLYDGNGKLSKLASGITMKANSGYDILSANLSDIVNFPEVGISNNVFMIGYPRSLSLNDESLEPNQPLLRKGIVAGKNSVKHLVIIDSPAYPGNSGGPIWEEDPELGKVKLIGIVTEFVPLVERLKSNLYGYENSNITNSGYAIVVPFDDIIEKLKNH